MKKLNLTFNKCEDCPHCNVDNQEVPEFWGKHSCDLLNVIVDPESIPPNCPLEDAEEETPKVETLNHKELIKLINERQKSLSKERDKIRKLLDDLKYWVRRILADLPSGDMNREWLDPDVEKALKDLSKEN